MDRDDSLRLVDRDSSRQFLTLSKIFFLQRVANVIGSCSRFDASTQYGSSNTTVQEFKLSDRKGSTGSDQQNAIYVSLALLNTSKICLAQCAGKHAGKHADTCQQQVLICT